MSVKKWVMSDEWWVMEIEWRKLSDEKCLTKQAPSISLRFFFVFFFFSYDIIETETQKHVVERHFSTHTVGCKVSNTTQFQTNNHASSFNPYIVNYFFNPKLQTMADKNGEDENCINSPGDEFKVRRKRK